MERLKQLVEWFDNTPFEDMPKKAQKEISDGIVELIKYKALGTLDDLAALVQAENEGRVDIHPCTEGTAVYVIREVRNHYLEPYHYEIQVMAYKKYMLKNYGKTVFLEKGAAETALREGEK